MYGVNFHRLRARLGARRLSSTARAVSAAGLTYLSPEKLLRIERVLREVRPVAGDFAEFGVALGGSAIVIAERARRFHGFDVFGMIPEPASEKDDEKSKQRYATIKSGSSKGINGQTYYGYRANLLAEVERSFAQFVIPADGRHVILHQGLFEETIPAARLGKLAFAHIDCDWYDPVSYCLRSIDIAPGGAIVIDDYHDYGGCRAAVDEFLAAHPEFEFEDGPNPILRKISDPAFDA